MTNGNANWRTQLWHGHQTKLKLKAGMSGIRCVTSSLAALMIAIFHQKNRLWTPKFQRILTCAANGALVHRKLSIRQMSCSTTLRPCSKNAASAWIVRHLQTSHYQPLRLIFTPTANLAVCHRATCFLRLGTKS